MKFDLSHLFAGQEGFTDGQTRRELEYTIYGKLDDFSVLEKATKKEDQEQWHIPLESDDVGIRIRQINHGKCVQTVKHRTDGVKGKEEVESEITSDMYSMLQKSAASGYSKTRYYFQIPNSPLTWEVDVFKDISGQVNPWIKLDLEVPNEGTPIADLPFPLSEKIVAQGDKKTDDEVAQVNRLWDIDWNIKRDKPTMITENTDVAAVDTTKPTDEKDINTDMESSPTNEEAKKDEETPKEGEAEQRTEDKERHLGDT